MGNCFVYEEPYNRTLLANYDPYHVKNPPYRLECIMAYKEHFIQPNTHEMVTLTNKPYIPPKPILSKIYYHHTSSDVSK